MKILLINPPYHRLMGFRNIFLPLGIATIASYCKKVGNRWAQIINVMFRTIKKLKWYTMKISKSPLKKSDN